MLSLISGIHLSLVASSCDKLADNKLAMKINIAEPIIIGLRVHAGYFREQSQCDWIIAVIRQPLTIILLE